MFNKTKEIITQIKETNPLILNITNVVTMDFIANGLLSLGASPLMSQASEELADLLNLAQAVNLNLGTLDKNFLALCRQTCELSNKLNKPIIFDPVGAGASIYRTQACLDILNQYKIAIIRGNASEILALAGLSDNTKGVDSTKASQEAIHAAKIVAERYQATVVISGETDLIIDDSHMSQYQRGHPLMAKVTGSGCLLTAIIAAFHAVESDRFIAAQSAVFFYSICGEIAAKQASGPASFRTYFIDALYALPEQAYYETL